MHPTISLLGITISSYYTFYVLGFIAVFTSVILVAPKHGIDRDHIMRFLVIAVCVSLIGVKLSYFFTDGIKMLFEYYISHSRSKPTFSMLFYGTKFMGALLFSFLAAIFYTRYAEIPTFDFMALILIYLPLGLGIGRIGCFLNGCCYGTEYHGIFAVNFPGSGECHPLQLYETVWDFMAFVVLLIMDKKKAKKLTIITSFVFLTAGIRFINDYFRPDAKWLLNIVTTNQLLMLITAVTMIIYIIYKNKKEVESNGKT